MGDDGGDDDGDDDGEDGDGTSTTSWMKNGRELGAFGLGVQLSTIGVSLIANSTGTLRHMLTSLSCSCVLALVGTVELKLSNGLVWEAALCEVDT